MCEFSTESRSKWYSIFVDQGKVTAVLVSDDTKGRKYLRDDADMKPNFLQAVKALAAELPEEFRKMRQLIESDYEFWSLSESALLELIGELKSILD